MELQLKIPNCDIDKIVTPLVNIYSPAPAQSIVKQFICVSWHWELTVTRGSQDLYKKGESYMMLAQFLAWFTGMEVLIGGDFNLKSSEIEKLIENHNRLVQDGIDNIKPLFIKFGYMDCMTETIHRPQRRLRQLKLHMCKSLENSTETNNTETNFFVASKEMQLMETKHVTMESLSYRSAGLQLQTRMKADYRPQPTYTKTQMYIPQRAPKNPGG
jgi:hypothetical protein